MFKKYQPLIFSFLLLIFPLAAQAVDWSSMTGLGAFIGASRYPYDSSQALMDLGLSVDHGVSSRLRLSASLRMSGNHGYTVAPGFYYDIISKNWGSFYFVGHILDYTSLTSGSGSTWDLSFLTGGLGLELINVKKESIAAEIGIFHFGMAHTSSETSFGKGSYLFPSFRLIARTYLSPQ